jgi:Rrf2 family transcriptional regulator, nitric oxide-sensitive transcriptional repressor
MRLTRFTDYSLRVLMYLGVEPHRRATIAEIANSFEISKHHLTKVVHFLGKAGWLANLRGKGGGLELAQPPEDIVVGRVVRETEGAAVPAECFDEDGGRCLITRVCHLQAVLGEAVSAFYAVLDRYTLADLVHNRRDLSRLLFVAPAARPKARPRPRVI